jgi:hypothetical protein
MKTRDFAVKVKLIAILHNLFKNRRNLFEFRCPAFE